MPRLSHSLLHHANNISPLLSLVLRGTPSLPSAINELRWLRQHVYERYKLPRLHSRPPEKELLRLCRRRSLGEPLQYVLGSQSFGELDIKCRPGVLIPRPETEAYTTHLATLLNKGTLHPDLPPKPDYASKPPLTILDLCSGSGCISLLLYSLLSKTFNNLRIHGWDISPPAISLSVLNLHHNTTTLHLPDRKPPPVQFDRVDIFAPFSRAQEKVLRECDIIISNPPYISQRSFDTETSRSVRNWEPRVALVPERDVDGYEGVEREDVFYRRLMEIQMLFRRSKVLVMEVGDEGQAVRVCGMVMVMASRGVRVEVWRDWLEGETKQEEKIVVRGVEVPVKGRGNMRAVVVFSGDNER